MGQTAEPAYRRDHKKPHDRLIQKMIEEEEEERDAVMVEQKLSDLVESTRVIFPLFPRLVSALGSLGANPTISKRLSFLSNSISALQTLTESILSSNPPSLLSLPDPPQFRFAAREVNVNFPTPKQMKKIRTLSFTKAFEAQSALNLPLIFAIADLFAIRCLHLFESAIGINHPAKRSLGPWREVLAGADEAFSAPFVEALYHDALEKLRKAYRKQDRVLAPESHIRYCCSGSVITGRLDLWGRPDLWKRPAGGAGEHSEPGKAEGTLYLFDDSVVLLSERQIVSNRLPDCWILASPLFPGGRAVELLRRGKDASLVFEVARPGERELIIAVWALIGPGMPKDLGDFGDVRFAEADEVRCRELDWADISAD
jgi:hypothetical protein